MFQRKREKKMTKRCALCNSPARMYCDSDQASLCWRCDSKVHSANFLVARHCRSLLCHVCHSPTPWTASGTDFGPTVTVCRRCACRGAAKKIAVACGESEAEIESQDERSFDGDEDEDSDCEDDEDEEEEDGEDVQVVPWCSTPPPPATSCSSVEEYSSSSGRIGVENAVDSPVSSLKRAVDSSSDLRFQEDFERRSKRRDVGGAAAELARFSPEMNSIDVCIRPES